MKTLRRLFHRLTSWTTSAQDEELLRAEVEEHIAMQTAENLRAGVSPIEARRQAMLKFGNVEAIKDAYRDRSMYFTYRQENRSFEQFGVWSSGGASVTGVAEPEMPRALSSPTAFWMPWE